MRHAVAAVSSLLCLLLSASCGAGRAVAPLPEDRLSLRILRETFVAAGGAGSFELERRATPQGLAVDIHVRAAQQLQALFFELDYDAAQLTPLEVASSGQLGAAGRSLELSLLRVPGRVEFGAMGIHPQAGIAGVNGDALLATVVFERRPQAAVKRISTPPTDEASRPRASFDSNTNELSWDYYNNGDYNQDGRVAVADLTPIGIHFGEAVPAGSDPDGRDSSSILDVIDGSNDGTINIQDLSAIGQNFGHQVANHAVYLGDPAVDYPASNGEASKVTVLASLDFFPDMLNKRLHYVVGVAPLAPGMAYWVRPRDSAGKAGIPSAPADGSSAPQWYAQPVASAILAGSRSLLFTRPGESADFPCIAYTLYYTDGTFSFGQVYLAESSDPLGSDMAPTALAGEFPGGYGQEDLAACSYNNGTEDCIGIGFPSAASSALYWSEKPLGSPTFNPAVIIDMPFSPVAALSGILIDGQPAVGYQSRTFGANLGVLSFCRYLGSAFTPHVPILEEQTESSSDRYCSLALINGVPALAFYNAETGQLDYIRATTADGGFWPVGAVVAEAGSPGKSTGITPFLLEVEGRPAIFYREDSLSSRVMYKRADDAAGVDWPAAGILVASITSFDPPYNYAMSAASDAARTGVAYTRDGILYYKELNDAAGSFSAEEVISGLQPITAPSLAYVNGLPAVSYRQDTLDQLWFAIKH